MYAAAKADDAKIVIALLDGAADRNEVDDDGLSALDHAKSDEMADVLLLRGVNKIQTENVLKKLNEEYNKANREIQELDEAIQLAEE